MVVRIAASREPASGSTTTSEARLSLAKSQRPSSWTPGRTLAMMACRSLVCWRTLLLLSTGRKEWREAAGDGPARRVVGGRWLVTPAG